MSNKVLFIRPKNVYNYNNYPALNLIVLASKLVQAGYETEIINCAFESDPEKAIKNALTKDVLFVGVSMLTSEVPHAYEIMHFIKQQSTVPVVAGGWHCTLFPEQTAKSDLVDYVIAGEGEDRILALANSLKSGQRPQNKLFPKKILDMEGLPTPDYLTEKNIERFINSYLTDTLSRYVKQPMRWLPYESSRGCPSRCTFCINVVTGNTQYRKKSAEKVVSEIVEIVNKYKITHLKIIDDNFFVDIKRVIEICQGIVDAKLDITWDGECRCDYFNDRMINDEVLALAKRSGLIQLTLGIESGSQKTLDIMKKGITPAQAENAVKKCNDHGIIARSSFMLEIPGESIDDIKKTIRFIGKLRKYPYFSCGVGTFRPYPKCELTFKLMNEGYLKEPENFESWTDKSTIDLYTSAEYIRPWQINGRFSESAAYYLNIESSSRLGSHQLNDLIEKAVNNIFIFIAKIRNRAMFYSFSFDKYLYSKFLKSYYERQSKVDSGGEYPISEIVSGGEKK